MPNLFGCITHLALFQPPPASQVELQRMWERERGVICVRWSARAAPRLLDGLSARADATHMSLDGVSGAPCCCWLQFVLPLAVGCVQAVLF